MVDFRTYEVVKLEDVAEYARAKQGKIYPAGTSTLQISATRGGIGFLSEPGYVHTKNVAIIPQAGIDPLYFNIAMQRNIDLFMHKYATGINIQEHEVGKFPIYLHDYETQKAIVSMFRQLEHEMAVERDTVNALKDLKSNMLKNMFV
ncbi:restriction endonuclease subunit S [Ligilactobacillus salivarius]|uniref:restriction endonuclease subunit S n=1 Tax=Ligilactobacillus salivarius TaxID=1624 RepID=UPI00136E61C5|nr:restriction endonuclease subunit S [Ligilactobacillus salivarius]MYV14850.1 restriction endonuclease subunit S [Ligilactobacillus salivarius]MYZ83789.1 restriction endonuclease subunit S [Ligilactobacillus salivarius]